MIEKNEYQKGYEAGRADQVSEDIIVLEKLSEKYIDGICRHMIGKCMDEITYAHIRSAEDK
jgi:hypothetical protein